MNFMKAARLPENERQEFLDKAKKLVEKAGFDASYYFIEDRAGDVAYDFYTTTGNDPKNLIYVEEGFSRPQIKEISEVSAAVRGLQKKLSNAPRLFSART